MSNNCCVSIASASCLGSVDDCELRWLLMLPDFWSLWGPWAFEEVSDRRYRAKNLRFLKTRAEQILSCLLAIKFLLDLLLICAGSLSTFSQIMVTVSIIVGVPDHHLEECTRGSLSWGFWCDVEAQDAWSFSSWSAALWLEACHWTTFRPWDSAVKVLLICVQTSLYCQYRSLCIWQVLEQPAFAFWVCVKNF